SSGEALTGMPRGFELRTVEVPAGAERIYEDSGGRAAMVVIARGGTELECRGGRRLRLERGRVLWLVGLPLRALHNGGQEAALLLAVSRRLGSVRSGGLGFNNVP